MFPKGTSIKWNVENLNSCHHISYNNNYYTINEIGILGTIYSYYHYYYYYYNNNNNNNNNNIEEDDSYLKPHNDVQIIFSNSGTEYLINGCAF